MGLLVIETELQSVPLDSTRVHDWLGARGFCAQLWRHEQLWEKVWFPGSASYSASPTGKREARSVCRRISACATDSQPSLAISYEYHGRPECDSSFRAHQSAAVNRQEHFK